MQSNSRFQTKHFLLQRRSRNSPDLDTKRINWSREEIIRRQESHSGSMLRIILKKYHPEKNYQPEKVSGGIKKYHPEKRIIQKTLSWPKMTPGWPIWSAAEIAYSSNRMSRKGNRGTVKLSYSASLQAWKLCCYSKTITDIKKGVQSRATSVAEKGKFIFR